MGSQLVGSVAMAVNVDVDVDVDVDVEVEVGSSGTGYLEKKASESFELQRNVQMELV